jgi:hypothetical protein
MPRLPVRPLVFRTIIALVIVNATAGIVVIAAGSGQVGSTESHVLLTTGLLSLATLLALPCILAHEAGRPRPFTLLPSFAVSCLLIAVSLGIYVIWEEPDRDVLDKIAWSFGFAGAGIAHVCLISLVRMRRRWLWLQLLAILFTAALTAMIVSAFWTDLGDGGFDDWKVRLFTVVAILTAATSLLVSLVDRMLRSRPETPGTPRRPAYCPNCGAVLHMDDPRCLACGARFRVEYLDA